LSETIKRHEADAALPTAKMMPWRWRLHVVWVVPIVAALIAGYLVVDRVRESGSTITIKFQDGGGLRIGQTPIKYRGVPIGEVTGVKLSEDQQHVLVMARLQSSAASIAREGSIFWIVRPEVGIGNITGLRTVVTGPEIQVLPGTGKSASEFVGQERAPVTVEGEGLKIVLRAGRLGSLKPHSPVYYRGIEVGAVYELQLSADATTVDIRIHPTTVCVAGPSWLEVLERERCGGERRFVPGSKCQNRIAEFVSGRRNYFCDATAAERQTSTGRYGVPSL
jgi:paraquat-inducible protein B